MAFIQSRATGAGFLIEIIVVKDVTTDYYEFMKTIYKFFVLCSALCLLSTSAMSATDWVFDLIPGSVLGSFAADDFSVSSINGKESVSLMSTMPHACMGIAIGTTEGFVDLKGGVGMLLNGKLHSLVYLATIGLYIEIKPSVMIGPHASYASFSSPEWWGDTDITFKDASGYLLGFHIVAGDRVAYFFSVDYVSAPFDVDKMGSGVTTSDSTLDLSGLAAQFGVHIQF
jgi:hypothetical protein